MHGRMSEVHCVNQSNNSMVYGSIFNHCSLPFWAVRYHSLVVDPSSKGENKDNYLVTNGSFPFLGSPTIMFTTDGLLWRKWRRYGSFKNVHLFIGREQRQQRIDQEPSKSLFTTFITSIRFSPRPQPLWGQTYNRHGLPTLLLTFMGRSIPPRVGIYWTWTNDDG